MRERQPVATQTQTKEEAGGGLRKRRRVEARPFLRLSRPSEVPRLRLLAWQQFAPRKLTDVAGHDRAKEQAAQWLRGPFGRRPFLQEALVLAGPPGCGKSLLARRLLQEAGFKPVEHGALRAGSLKDYVRNLPSKDCEGQRLALLLDDVDDLDNAVFAELACLTLPLPVVATCVVLPRAAMTQGARALSLRALSDGDVGRIVARVHREAWSKECSPERARQLVEASGGDGRQAALRTCLPSDEGRRDCRLLAFSACRALFAGQGDVELSGAFEFELVCANVPLACDDLERCAEFAAGAAEMDARRGDDELALLARRAVRPRSGFLQLIAPQASAVEARRENEWAVLRAAGKRRSHLFDLQG